MDMNVITKRQIILGVRDRWLSQYKHYDDNYKVGWSKTKTAGEIRNNLASLDLETCTSKDVDNAIGVKRWANLDCDFCDKDCDSLLRMGEEIDYEARWLDVCKDCLGKANSIICAKS